MQIPLPPPHPTPAPVDDDAILPGGSPGVPTQKFQPRISRHLKLTPRHTHPRRCQLPPANPNAPPPPRRPLMLCARGSPCWASWGAVGSRSHTRPRYTRGLLKRQANCCSQVQHTWAERQGSGVWSRTKCGRWPARQQSGGPLRRGCDLPLRQGVGVDFEYRVARAAPLSRPSRRCRATAGVAATVNSPSRLPPRTACAPGYCQLSGGRSPRIPPRRRKQSGRGARSRPPIGTSPPIRRRPSAAPRRHHQPHDGAVRGGQTVPAGQGTARRRRGC